LTPRGEQLAARMGAYYRAHYAGRGLLPARGCPDPNAVHVWADVDQRTRQTGVGLLEGMFPGCGLPVRNGPTDKPDPMFHPVRAGVCSVDADRARAAVLERAGGNLDRLLRAQREPLRQLQAVLGCCAPKLCQAIAKNRCTLTTLPAALDIRHKDGSVRLTGAIPIGSTASEIFLLEYAQGLPLNRVAWGRASSPAAIRSLLRLHRVQFDLIERTPYLAARQGSALVHQVLETLRETAEGSSTPPSAVPAESKLVVYVGHDTNLANIGGMLGLHWRLTGYLPDETPPAGALAFELLRETAAGSYFVRMTYFSQTLDQMRRMTRLAPARPPARAAVALPGCADPKHGGACPWSEFAAAVKRAVDPACLAALR
jgi:4-phytase/acid phosphatase